MCVQLTHNIINAIYEPFLIIGVNTRIVITFIQPVFTVEHNEDLLPLRVAHFGRLAEQDLVFVADKDAVQDKLADGDVSQIPDAVVLAHTREQLDSPLGDRLPICRRGYS